MSNAPVACGACEPKGLCGGKGMATFKEQNIAERCLDYTEGTTRIVQDVLKSVEDE